jgi:hypothetical protein
MVFVAMFGATIGRLTREVFSMTAPLALAY